MRRLWMSSFMVACLLGAGLSTSAYSQQTVSRKDSQGIMVARDLRDAYLAELQTRDRYLAYAQKADEEGYGQVASMFRAIARGEQIHAANLESYLTQPVATAAAMEPVQALSTEENLQTALAEQRYERDVMYPQFIKQARDQRHKDLERTLRRNAAAEPLHFAWYAQALGDLNAYRGDNVDFLVCPKCGNTLRTLSEGRCPLCGTGKEGFERVR